MKTHAIIPIFIPHAGCPHDCVFCNQKAITARTEIPTVDDAEDTILRHLATIRKNPDIRTVEIAFYGGSFTAIPLEQQASWLALAQKYKQEGLVDKIHLSTRPDCITQPVLEQLAAYGADIIELGVQSFDGEVLRRAARGHDAAVVFRAAEMIRQYGFQLGIQLMTGLPGDSYEKCIQSAEQTIRVAPEIARIYPTVIIRDTALFHMYEAGQYQPPDLMETVRTVKDMYRKLTGAGIQVIRVGLKSTDLIRNGDGTVVGGYHPAFRQLVESEIAREDLQAQLAGETEGEVRFRAHPASFSNMIGHRKKNRIYFKEHYPGLNIRYQQDPAIPPGAYHVAWLTEQGEV